MIPNRQQCTMLWDKYNLPEKKRIHVSLVRDVALVIGRALLKQGTGVDLPLLEAAALLHDIDKAVEKRPQERHPDTGVRILTEEGLGEVARVVERHSVHMILDEATAPQTWEQKVLFLADKMVKQEVVGVDGRFALWKAESLPKEAIGELDQCYPKVKALEKEIFNLAHIDQWGILQSLKEKTI